MKHSQIYLMVGDVCGSTVTVIDKVCKGRWLCVRGVDNWIFEVWNLYKDADGCFCSSNYESKGEKKW